MHPDDAIDRFLHDVVANNRGPAPQPCPKGPLQCTSSPCGAERLRTALLAAAGLTALGYLAVPGVARAGWGGGTHILVLGPGNDKVANGGEQRITAYGEAGNDTIEDSKHNDTLSAGTGTDTVYFTPGDNVTGAENLIQM